MLCVKTYILNVCLWQASVVFIIVALRTRDVHVYEGGNMISYTSKHVMFTSYEWVDYGFASHLA